MTGSRLIVSAFAILLAGACSGTPPGSIERSKNILGYGLEVTSITNTIYEINVRNNALKDVEAVRDAALLKAAEIAISQDYPAFEIIGGTGFRKRSRQFRAGPLPVILPGEPSGGLVIKLKDASDDDDASTYDARKIQEASLSRQALQR